MTDQLAEIRARDALKGHGPAGVTMTQSEADRRYLLAELDRLAAENRLVRAILEQDRPGSCGRTTVHKPHRWLPSRTALDCPGLGPDAAAPRDAPRVAYKFGFERMDPPDSGPMLIGRPEADVRAVMTDTAARFPECEYALRRRIVGPWVTLEVPRTAR